MQYFDKNGKEIKAGLEILPSIFFLCGSAKLLRNADRLLYQACEEEKERVEHG